MDVTLAELRAHLCDPDLAERGWWIAKLMRQAKPDDALTFMPAAEMRARWDDVEPFLGREREMWRWLLQEFGRDAE